MTDDDTTPGAPAAGTPRWVWLVGGVLVVLIVVAGIALTARDTHDEDTIADGIDLTSTSTSTSSTASTASTTSTTPATSTPTDASEPPVDLSGAATTPVSVPYPDTDTAQLTAVRVAAHDGYDRVVFEFTGELPGYDIAYLDGPLLEEGSGADVAVAGDRVLSVRMSPASGVVLSGETFTRTYTGPDRIPGTGVPVTEVVEAGDFESQMTWGIGTTAGQPFTVSTLSDPTRLVIDVVG